MHLKLVGFVNGILSAAQLLVPCITLGSSQSSSGSLFCTSHNLFQTFAEQALCLLLNPRDYVIAEVVNPRRAAYTNALGREQQAGAHSPCSQIQPCPSVRAALHGLTGY